MPDGKPVQRANKRAAGLAPIVTELRAAGITSKKGIAEALNERGIPTTRGSGRWYHPQVGGEDAGIERLVPHERRSPMRPPSRDGHRRIAKALNERRIPTVAGSGRWHHTQVWRLLARLAE